MDPAGRLFRPGHFFVEQPVAALPFTRRILDRAPGVETTIVASAGELTPPLPERSMLLAQQRGPFMRYCPGTQKHICCMYHNLDVAAGCDLGCSYCILQGYLNVPVTTLYCNVEEMWTELEGTLSGRPNEFFRVGTGEMSDSLTFDHLTGLSVDLVKFFSNRANAVIELKSKNLQIENFIALPHRRRTVVSWSVNAGAVVASEEPQTPGLDERLRAAAEVQKAGFRLGFHFDPMIHHPQWREGYRQVVEQIFSFVHPENLAWISLGALRYPPMLDRIIRENHPESDIYLGELLPGIDQKYRYFKPIRIEMFRALHGWIRAHAPDAMIYLCMESDEVWRKAFGYSPASSAGLKKWLDDRVR